MKVVVQGGGSYAGVKGFIIDQATIRRGDAKPSGHLVSGHVALFASSSPMSDEDRKDFNSRHGYDVTEILIAMDAVAIYVNAQNPIKGLTMEQVDAIFGKDRKRGLRTDVAKWGELGLESGWESLPIHLYGRDKKSGTRTFFMQEALSGGQLKSDVVEEPGSASEILDISRDPIGIRYAGIGLQASTVRVVPLARTVGSEFVLRQPRRPPVEPTRWPAICIFMRKRQRERVSIRKNWSSSSSSTAARGRKPSCVPGSSPCRQPRSKKTCRS
jgi:ABC-type phosphate transport system, periplasmic component